MSCPDDDHMLYPTVGELFQRLALELDALSEMGARIERSVCSGVLTGSLDDECVREMQQLDQLLQQIAALRGFVAVVGDEQMGETRISINAALGMVPLAQMKARLGAGRGDKASALARRVEIF